MLLDAIGRRRQVSSGATGRVTSDLFDRGATLGAGLFPQKAEKPANTATKYAALDVSKAKLTRRISTGQLH